MLTYTTEVSDDKTGVSWRHKASKTAGCHTCEDRSEAKVAQLCPTLCDPMDCTVHGIFQARILEWVAIPFSRGSSQPRDRTQASHIVERFFIV